MIELKKIAGQAGIPIYHQPMPEIVRSVSLSWLIFTGAADDESIGSPGLYHWFEHVPHRGTVAYPNGYADTFRMARYGGSNGAWTALPATCYWAVSPLVQWKEGLSLITDLFSRPLITDEAVSAERLIIYNEIVGRNSDAAKSSSSELNEILYQGHSFGHSVLGTEESLNKMNADTLRRAHKAGYDRSRASLFVVGNISEKDLLNEVEALLPIIPDNGLAPRSAPADFGKRPWSKTSVVHRETAFASSLVYVLFPFDTGSPVKNYRVTRILSELFSFGLASSPLYRIIREEGKLVYRTWVQQFYGTGGGLFGFAAECKRENFNAVIDGFRKVFRDPVVRSAERLNSVKMGVKGALDMRPIDPSEFTDIAIDRLIFAGRLVNDSDICREFDYLTREGVEECFQLLDPENARTVIFEGKG